ncbi:MAG: SurA N-terminal domain-containing protein [Elusimicrobia bacterium]|nr:SurA N-terminal domain-containing protein [Elusimicrobiota bacterium]
MIGFFRKHKKKIFVGVTAGFLAGIFVGLGGYLGSGSRNANLAAKIGKNGIAYDKYAATVSRVMENFEAGGKVPVTEDMRKKIENGVLRELIMTEALAMSAEENGIKVTDKQVADEIESNPAFSDGGVFNQEAYFRAVMSRFRMRPEQFEQELKRQDLAMSFKGILLGAVKVPPSEVKQMYIMAGKDIKNFEKEKDSFTLGLSRMVAQEITNGYIQQFIVKHGVTNYISSKDKDS